MRVFIAIEMPEEACRILAQLQQPFTSVRGIKLARPEQCHLTLKFLGEIDEPRCAAIQEELSRIREPAFGLSLKKLGAFPDAKHPRVIWAGVTNPPELARLAGAVELATSAIAADKAFAAHITLARVSSRCAAFDPALLDARVPDCRIAVNDFACYESKSTPAGVRYTVLRRFALS